MLKNYCFNYNLNFYMLQVLLDSIEEDVCAVVSIQPFSCPIFEEFGGLAYMKDVYFQTMLKSATFTIRKNDYPHGFFLVIKVIEDDACKKVISDVNSVQESVLLKRGKSFKYVFN